MFKNLNWNIKNRKEDNKKDLTHLIMWKKEKRKNRTNLIVRKKKKKERTKLNVRERDRKNK